MQNRQVSNSTFKIADSLISYQAKRVLLASLLCIITRPQGVFLATEDGEIDGYEQINVMRSQLNTTKTQSVSYSTSFEKPYPRFILVADKAISTSAEL